jgi:hypothetical protein
MEQERKDVNIQVPPISASIAYGAQPVEPDPPAAVADDEKADE